jgi:hypothetical protein
MNKGLTPVEMRIAIARSWSDRVQFMIETQKEPDIHFSEKLFCLKHGFDCGFFNRNKNLRSVPSQRTVNRIEAALEKEDAIDFATFERLRDDFPTHSE